MKILNMVQVGAWGGGIEGMGGLKEGNALLDGFEDGNDFSLSFQMSLVG